MTQTTPRGDDPRGFLISISCFIAAVLITLLCVAGVIATTFIVVTHRP